MLASVIIPTLDEERFIENCLRSLSLQSIPRELYEIIVVDGGSSDRTIKIARKFADKVIKDVKGIGAARQAGLKAALAPIVCFTDADSIVDADWLRKVLDSFKEGVVCVTGPAKPLEERIELGVKLLFLAWNTVVSFGARLNIWGAIGLNFASYRDTLLKIGGFKNIAFEDMEISCRLSKLGKIMYNWDLAVRTSSRRYKAWGIFKTPIKVLSNAIPVYFGFKPLTKWIKID